MSGTIKSMKIDDLIEELGEFREKHGNVLVLNYQFGRDEGFEIEEVREHEDGKYGKVALLW